jgi:hypothetical protein
METLTEIKRGDEAERLLENPIYVEAVTKVRNGILTAMQDSALGDESTHHRLVIALQLLSQIEKQIQDVAVTGKMAKLQANSGTFGRIRAAAGF